MSEKRGNPGTAVPREGFRAVKFCFYVSCVLVFSSFGQKIAAKGGKLEVFWLVSPRVCTEICNVRSRESEGYVYVCFDVWGHCVRGYGTAPRDSPMYDEGFQASFIYRIFKNVSLNFFKCKDKKFISFSLGM